MAKRSPKPARTASPIDEVMERASVALVETRYWEAEALAIKGLLSARRANDFERMARACLPLQEARRQKRQLACDAGTVNVVGAALTPKSIAAGCYLIRPPMLGVDAQDIRDLADRKRIAVSVLAREPMTRQGQWPVVAVGERRADSLVARGATTMMTLRLRVAPPEGTIADASTPTKDRGPAPSVAWFTAAQEALGDAAIASLRDEDPPAVNVDELLDMLDALPDHEKLVQRLERECRAAMRAPVVTRPVRRETTTSF